MARVEAADEAETPGTTGSEGFESCMMYNWLRRDSAVRIV
jgi:hypothetical protein